MSTAESTTTTADAQAFLRDFRSLSAIGETPGHGVDRQAATAADAQARAWFTSLAAQYGFRTEVDRTGNVFALLEWTPGAPYVLVGSHLDSQPTAGKYDGAYGVAAALHAGRRLAESTVPGEEPKYNLAVVNWFNEEGCRFAPSMMGSSVYTGKLPVEEALATRTTRNHCGPGTGSHRPPGHGHGPHRGGVRGDPHRTRPVHGRHRNHHRPGHSNWAANKYEFVVHGEQAHTGSTVIADRKDALLGASMLVVLPREIAQRLPRRAAHLRRPARMSTPTRPWWCRPG